MSRRSESVTGGGGGSGLEGSSLNWGERSDRGLKYPEGDGKLGSKGVVDVDEVCDGAVRIELARRFIVRLFV